MKKLILLIMMVFCLSGCGEDHQNKNNDTYRKQLMGGYFTVLEKWKDYEFIVYANDTKIKYFIHYGSYGFGITPLYNTDGTIQVYKGE